MSENVVKLKKLLFDQENQTLFELQRRLEHLGTTSRAEREKLAEDIAKMASNEAGLRLELSERVDDVFARAGTHQRFQDSVAEVLDKALSDAEISRHSELSTAIAPLVTKTIKTEIRNSQDDLVEALYPMTGRLVQSYVASAIKDMMDNINRRMNNNGWMMRLRAISSGRSVAELALAENFALQLEDLVLIRRGTGEVLERWPSIPGRANVDHLISGVLTAVNDIAVEAFNVKGSALRRLEVDDDNVFIRISPTHLLVAKCSGEGSDAVEAIIDENFIEFLDARRLRMNQAADDGEGDRAGEARPSINSTTDEVSVAGASSVASGGAGTLEDLSEHLKSAIAKRQEELRSAVFNPAKILLWLLGLGLAGLLGWWIYATALEERVRSLARDVIGAEQQLEGYPIGLTVAPYGRRLRIEGLTPSASVKRDLVRDLRRDLPSTTTIDDGLTVVASADAKIKPAVDRLRLQVEGLEEDVPSEVSRLQSELGALQTSFDEQLLARRLSQTAARLDLVEAGFLRMLQTQPDGMSAEMARDLRKRVGGVKSELAKVSTAQSETTSAGQSSRRENRGETVSRAIMTLNGIATDVTKAVGTAGLKTSESTTTPSDITSDAAGLSEQVERLALQADELSTLVTAINQAMALRPLVVKSERETLEDFARANAIFFVSDTRYRDTSVARATLQSLVDTAKGGTLLIRAVGFTDGTGSLRRNQILAQERAEKVVADLIALGMARTRLVAVGREDRSNLASTTGDGSPNRRVEFEIGFVGEAAQ